MRIKFIEHEAVSPDMVGQEFDISELKAVGHTIVAGYRIAANGILKPFVENITDYDENGVERIPEPPQYQAEEESEIMLEIE